MNRKMNRLENIRKSWISHFSNYEWFSNWEDFLTFDYWKSWRIKTPIFQTEEELEFYTKRLGEITDLIRRCKKYGVGKEKNDDLLIKKEEIRLQNISKEDFEKEDKFADVEFKELSTKEMLNDPWFSKQIQNIFDSKDTQQINENKSDDEIKCDTSESNNNQNKESNKCSKSFVGGSFFFFTIGLALVIKQKY